MVTAPVFIRETRDLLTLAQYRRRVDFIQGQLPRHDAPVSILGSYPASKGLIRPLHVLSVENGKMAGYDPRMAGYDPRFSGHIWPLTGYDPFCVSDSLLGGDYRSTVQ